MLDDFEQRIQTAHESPEFIEFMSDVLRNDLAFEEQQPPAPVTGETGETGVTGETAVDVAGRRFVAKARVGNGRWRTAGRFDDEGQAWRAARALLAEMREAMAA